MKPKYLNTTANHIWFAAGVLGQVLDGLLTYLGITKGLSTEGNPIILGLIHLIGFVPAIVFAKIFGSGCMLFLWSEAKTLGPLKVVTTMLWLIAVLPWALLLLGVIKSD